MKLSLWLSFCGALSIFPKGTSNQSVRCGTDAMNLGRIGRGVSADIGEVPWQARLNLNGYICGGTIIGTSWIITAAHCFFYGQVGQRRIFPIEVVDVTVGSLYLSRSLAGEQNRKIDRVIIHERFNESQHDYDYALVHLSEPIRWSATVRPACLARACSDEPSPGTICVISGWGTNRSDDNTPQEILQKAPVPIISKSKCQASFTEVADIGDFVLTDRMICAGFPKNSPDACQGDSGGPLIFRSKVSPNTFLLVGIISFGYECGYDGAYGVYSRVCRVSDWIESHINNGSTLQLANERTTRAPAVSNVSTTSVAAVPQTCSKTLDVVFTTRPTVARASELPWQVKLNIRLPGGTRNVTCGATVIASQWLLTSSQCAPDNRTRISVRSGSGRGLGNINIIYRHPRFDSDTFDFDFSLLKMQSPLSISDDVSPICLPRQCGSQKEETDVLNLSVYEDNTCITSGWESISLARRSGDSMKKAAVGAKTTDECIDKLGDLFTDRSLCVQDRVSNIARCQTDIGGPLVCKTNNDDDEIILTGVASYAPFNCGNDDSIVVYGRVCTIVSWITGLILS